MAPKSTNRKIRSNKSSSVRTRRASAPRATTDRIPKGDFFAKAFYASPHPIGITELKTGRCLEINDACLEIFGFRRDEVIGKTTLTLGIWPDPEERARFVERVRTHGPVRNFEITMRVKGGTPRQFLISTDAVALGGKPCLVTIGNDVTERKAAEAALRESEQRFRAIYDQTYEFIGLLNPDGTVIDANQTALAFRGVRLAEVVGKPFWETPWWDISPEQQFKLKTAIAEAATGRFARIKAQHRALDGTIEDIDVSLTPITDRTGRVTQIIPEGRRITSLTQAQALLQQAHEELESRVQERTAELEHANQALRKSEALNRAFLENSATVAWMKDAEGRHIYLSPNFERRFGIKSGDCLGKTDFELWPKDVAEAFRANDLTVLKNRRGIEVEEEARNPDGSRSWWLSHKFPYQDAEGNWFVGGLGVEITARKQAEDELRHSEAFIASVVDNLPNMVFIKDAKTLRFVRMNKAGERLLGFTERDLVGKNDYDFFPKDEADFFTAKDREVLVGRRLLDIPEEPIKTHAGIVRFLHTKKIPIFDQEDQPKFLLGISEDITEHKQAVEQLKERARLSDFAAEASLCLNKNEPLNHLLQECVEATVNRLGAAFARIWVLGPGDLCKDCHKAEWCVDRTQCLHLKASAGLSTNLNGEYRRVPMGALKIGRIAQGAGPLCTNDVVHSDRLPNKEWMREHGLQSFAGFPLVVEGRVFGVLGLFGRAPLSNITLQTIESVCHGLATAIARKQAEEILRQQQQEMLRQQDQLRDLTSKLIKAQESERRRMARDLHDDVSQRLAALVLDVASLEQHPPLAPESVAQTLEPIRERLEELSDDVHNLAYQLHPSLLEHAGLQPAVEDHVRQVTKRTNIPIFLKIRDLPSSILLDHATCLFRVLQEGLQNVVKHAHATEVSVKLSGSGKGIGLSVTDNGKGFDPQDKSAHQKGLGLSSMQERLRLLDGFCRIHSRKGDGTKVCVWIPTKEGRQ